MKFWKKPKNLEINKRQRMILSAVILSSSLFLIQLLNISWRYQAIALLSILAYGLSAWSLSEGLEGVEWLMVLSLPTLFTAGVGLFYFLMPARWFTGLPVIGFYGLGIYILLLIENIFSVASIRTIQLLRSGQAVGFLLTLVSAYLLYDTVLSYKMPAWNNFALVSLISLPLILPGLWCINLEEKITRRLGFYTLALSLVQGEMALAFSFWPVTVSVGSLALTSILYVSLGLTQHQLSERLFKKTVNEYLIVGIVVLAVIFLTTPWG